MRQMQGAIYEFKRIRKTQEETMHKHGKASEYDNGGRDGSGRSGDRERNGRRSTGDHVRASATNGSQNSGSL